MAYKNQLTKVFYNDYKRLPKQLRQRIKLKIKEVTVKPTRYKKLHYDLSGSCPIRISKLKVFFL